MWLKSNGGGEASCVISGKDRRKITPADKIHDCLSPQLACVCPIAMVHGRWCRTTLRQKPGKGWNKKEWTQRVESLWRWYFSSYTWEAVVSKRRNLPSMDREPRVMSHLQEAMWGDFSGDSTSTVSLCKNSESSCGFTGLVWGSIEARPEMEILGRSTLGRRGTREVGEDRGRSRERSGASEFWPRSDPTGSSVALMAADLFGFETRD